MKLSLRFVVLVVALTAAVAASAQAGLQALTQLDAALTRIVDNDVERLLAITHSRRLFRSMVVLERDYILARTEDERKPLDKKMVKAGEDLLEQIEKYSKLMPQDDARTVEDIRGARTRWIERDEDVRAAAHKNQDQALELAKLHAQDPVSWEKAIGGLVKLSEERLDASVKQNHAVFVAARSKLLWVSGIAALLATVFGSLIFFGIRRNMLQIVQLNTNLEAQVRARTASLVQREQALKLVLDSTGDGILEAGRDGMLTGVSSAAAVRWFGAVVPGIKLSAYLYADDSDAAAHFGMAFDQLAEDILPWELCRDQMPRRLELNAMILELDFKRVFEHNEFAKILITVRDVTEAVQSERAERSAREQQSLITKLLQDKAGFAQFVKDSEALIVSLAGAQDEVVAKRDLHTLKGNSGFFGLTTVAEFCHAIEDRLAVEGGLPSAAEVADLAGLWRTRMQSIETFLTELGGSRLEVDLSDHARLIESLLSRKDYAELVTMVELWSWPRTSERLTRMRAHAEHLATRLGKSIEVSLEHNDLRLPREYLERFWPTLIHVVRNAVDHGSEPAEQREAQGKSPRVNLKFRTEQTDDVLVIEVQDDGPGVDRAALLRSARNKQADIADDISLRELVFMDGVSSRANVTETSGRGVGLAAVRQACEAEGGEVELLSEPGKGTTFRFRFRRPVVKPGALAARIERRWSLQPLPAANQNANGVSRKVAG
ncbi:MAG TPA: ATP-binding protein [Polyangiales bacterium]|nr:ATP-binding protein [Polyangiales bacterium]